MKCRINISSKGSGWNDNRAVDGELIKTDNTFELRYLLDGDKCVLTATNDKVIQQRSGVQHVDISFEEGKSSLCTIGNGGFNGSYEIFTRSLKITSGAGGLKISLEYTNGSERELITLTVTALICR